MMAVAARGCPQRSGRSRPGRGPSAAHRELGRPARPDDCLPSWRPHVVAGRQFLTQNMLRLGIPLGAREVRARGLGSRDARK
jgi:hypothetical protein